MTNLATSGVNGSNEYDTLDSSGSGGKTISGDSGGGSSSRNQLPEKRSRKLSRPKSLTNLVSIFILKNVLSSSLMTLQNKLECLPSARFWG
jgi:hypothetical protein